MCRFKSLMIFPRISGILCVLPGIESQTQTPCESCTTLCYPDTPTDHKLFLYSENTTLKCFCFHFITFTPEEIMYFSDINPES